MAVRPVTTRGIFGSRTNSSSGAFVVVPHRPFCRLPLQKCHTKSLAGCRQYVRSVCSAVYGSSHAPGTPVRHVLPLRCGQQQEYHSRTRHLLILRNVNTDSGWVLVEERVCTTLSWVYLLPDALIFSTGHLLRNSVIRTPG